MRLFVMIFIMCNFVSAQDDYRQWAHSMNIYFNTDSLTGIPVSVVLKQFPVLVRLDNSNFPFFDSVKTGGADIRFSNSTGEHLPYEIERWSNNAGPNDTAVIWVKTDSIVPASSLQHIVLYWGNRAASDSSKSSLVFSSANWYSGVYHLGEDDKSGVGTAGYYKDATGVNNGYDSIGSNTDNSGYIGRGHKFGKRDVIPVGRYNPSTTRMTLSAWVKWSGDESYWQAIIAKRDNQSSVYWELNFSSNITPKGISVYNSSSENGFGIPMFSANVWHHVALSSVNGASNETILYVDGVKAGSTTMSWGSASNAEILIGNTDAYRSGRDGNDSGGTYWRGYLDEVRLENAAHSNDWIRINYENQRIDNQKLMKFRSKPIITVEPVDVVNPSDDTVSFSVGAFGDSLIWQWYKSTDGITWTVAPGTADKSIYSMVTTQTDSGSFYRCIVSNDIGSDTSATVGLRICNPLVFLKQPISELDCPVGKNVSFSVEVSDVTSKYQWEKSFDGVEWVAVENETSAIFNYSVHSETIDRKYRCKVMSGCDTAYSDVANMTICVPVAISQKPASQSVIEGKTATFTIGTRKSAKAFQWYSKKTGSAAWLPVQDAVDSVYSLVADTSVNGTFYCCIAKGSCDSVKSDSVLLTVYRKVHASFALSDSVGQAPLGITVTDLSTGNINKWKWVCSDTAADSSAVSKNLTKLYKTANTYTIKLIVSGPGGVDTATKTVRVYPAGANPVIMSGRMIAPDRVQLTYRNFSSIPVSQPSVPFASSIKLFYRTGTVPADTLSPVKMLKIYDAASFKAHGNEYCDTVAVEPLSVPDSVYGFTTQIIWNDGIKTSFGSHNGCTVVMKNNETPVNRLVLKGSYIPWDSADFTIDSAGTINWNIADSVAFWYGVGTDSIPDFSRLLTVKKWSKDDFLKSVVNGKLTFRIVDNRFNSDVVKLNCAAILIGKNGIRSLPVISFFNIGRVRPENNVALQAHAVNANTITLSWNKQTGIEKMRIYYRANLSIPLEYSFSGLDSIIVNRDSVSCTINQLNQKTRYYFGAQIYKDGMWSFVTSASSATDSTPAAAASSIINSIKITRAFFDTINETMNIYWTVNAESVNGLQIGASYSTAANRAGDSIVFQVFGVSKQADSCKLTFREAIEFAADYTILFRMRKTNENWTGITDSSKVVIHMPSFAYQTVNYAFRNVPDTTLWFNKTIRFTTPASNVSAPKILTGKIMSFVPDTALVKGFINVGNGFSFQRWQASDSLTIGLKCMTIPAPYKLNDVRIYRFDGKNILVERGTTIDSAGMFVTLKTDDLYRPFVAMIDVAPPVLTRISKHDTIINVNSDYFDTIYISDNIANLTWYSRSSGGSDPLFKSGYNSSRITMTASSDTAVIFTTKKFTGEDGARSFVYATDGRSLTKLDVSRRVRIANSDTVNVPPMKWFPLKITSRLDTVAMSQFLGRTQRCNGLPAADSRYMRIFRWSESALNAQGTGNWVEYSAPAENDFNLTNGKLFWIKTKDRLSISMGAGTSLPLNDTVKIKLFPKKWTDFAVPFHFDMKLADIIGVSRKYSLRADSLQFYKWKSDSLSGRYSAAPFYIPGVKGAAVTDSTLILSSINGCGFTVWNNANDTALLVFAPPSDDTANKTISLSKGTSKNSRLLKVNVRLADGHTIGRILCGLDEKLSSEPYCPLPPSMEQFSAGVLDKTGKVCAHMIHNRAEAGGCSYTLAFTNNSGAEQQIYYNVESGELVDPAIKTAVFCADDNQLTYVADVNSVINVTVGSGATVYRQLLMGTDEYIHNFHNNVAMCKLALSKVYPNPVRFSAQIRYSLPFAPVSRVEFIIVNMLGRIVFKKTDIVPSVTGGTRSFRWDLTGRGGTRTGSGVYILKMVAYNNYGRSIGQFEQMLTVLP